jgi:hypothetical protein
MLERVELKGSSDCGPKALLRFEGNYAAAVRERKQGKVPYILGDKRYGEYKAISMIIGLRNAQLPM